MAKSKSRKRSGTTKKATSKPPKKRGNSSTGKTSPDRKLKKTTKVTRNAPAKSNRTASAVSSPAAPPVPTAAMAIRSMSSGKPRKNQAGLLSKELEHFRQLLLGKRRELLGDMSSMEHEALQSTTGSNLSNLPVHMADMGTDNYEQEFTLGLVEKDRVLLREINTALAKIHDGTYGICEGTGKAISKARLEARPWARYSIEYARKLEMGLIRPMI